MTTTQTSELKKAARKAAMKTKAGARVTGEQIRTRCEDMNIVASSPSAWGGVIQGLVRQGILENTGETARMEAPQARGRRSPVYTRLATRTRTRTAA